MHPIDARIQREQRKANARRLIDYYVREWRHQCGVKPRLTLTRFAPSSKNQRIHLLCSDVLVVPLVALAVTIIIYIIKH